MLDYGFFARTSALSARRWTLSSTGSPRAGG